MPKSDDRITALLLAATDFTEQKALPSELVLWRATFLQGHTQGQTAVAAAATADEQVEKLYTSKLFT